MPATTGPGLARLKFVLTSTTVHKVNVAAFASEFTYVEANHSEVRPSTPLEIRVDCKPGTDVVVVVYSPVETKPAVGDVFSLPKEGAKASERNLKNHSFFHQLEWAHQVRGVSHVSAQLAGELFTSIDRSFVLYATDPKASHCGLLMGEPVLLFDVLVLQPNGRFAECERNVDDFLSPTPPATLAMPAPEQPVLHTYNTWNEEEFVGRAATDPRIAKYVAKKEIARQCDIKTWEKLARQVAKQCQEDALFKERDAIRASLAKLFMGEETKRLEAP